MSPSLQVADALAAACAQAMRRAVDYLLGRQHPRRILVGRPYRRHHARIRFHPAGAVAASAGQDGVWNPPIAAADRKSGAVDSGAAVARWRVQHLRRRAVGNQRDGEGVHGAEAGRPGLRRSESGAGARADSGAGRTAGGQQLRQGQPEPVRSVSARAHAVDSAGVHAAGQADLRNVVVDAGDRDSAVDRARHESAASGARRIHAE